MCVLFQRAILQHSYYTAYADPEVFEEDLFVNLQWTLSISNSQGTKKFVRHTREKFEIMKVKLNFLNVFDRDRG